MSHVSLAEALANAVERDALLESLERAEAQALLEDWQFWARPEQLAPPGDWRLWLMMAGRGFGKTRAGAEWVHQIARNDGTAQIALVGVNLAEVRAVMVEGKSGLLATAKRRENLIWEPSLRRLRWPSGAMAMAYSAAEPESLRGPEHSHGWCDEIAKWDAQTGSSFGRRKKSPALALWENLMLGLRLGPHQQVLATTTPRPVPLLKLLLEQDDIAVTHGRTADNRANLAPGYIAAMQASYGASLLGRQELDGELIEDRQGALWKPSLIEKCRGPKPSLRDLVRIVVGVDPPASAHGDACGIVVAGRDAVENGWILADASVEQASPEQWARAVAQTYAAWDADRVVAESNQGGAMVASVLRAASLSLPVKLVHARRGKSARAEPVAALYEAGRICHAGLFPDLEDQMCGLMTGGGYIGPGRSPDRADALVWALTELMLGPENVPRVRWL
ncbi:DNA-packaging protein [Alterisphingorhabdus coralli]|uniref:Terminase family protein n=1 Tax=Alterisphingorhabdus coralli TaxID=3071408 RepID=A0AA97F767_9SPHN|nr:terminase family protein [Parasphingorhabdus sp. SCSIO 66989]WOE75674.1 terminase family protein [Parasphingorhabdus sp. SCSIO 66989]